MALFCLTILQNSIQEDSMQLELKAECSGQKCFKKLRGKPENCFTDNSVKKLFPEIFHMRNGIIYNCNCSNLFATHMAESNRPLDCSMFVFLSDQNNIIVNYIIWYWMNIFNNQIF